MSIPNDFAAIKGVLQAKLVSQRKIILIWEVSAIPGELTRLFYNRSLQDLVHTARIYDVTGITFTGDNAHHFYEIAIPYHKGYWFIKGLAGNRSFIAELGVKLNETDFFPILRSNCIQTPSVELIYDHEMNQDFFQYQQMEDRPPKWVDYVSTYTYYEESKNMEKINEPLNS